MMKKIIIAVVALALVVALFVTLTPELQAPKEDGKQAGGVGDVVEADTTPKSGEQVAPPPSNTANEPQKSAELSGEDDIGGGVDILVEEVSYDGKSFSPSSLTLKKGDIVIFRNKSQKSFWPASANHPDHKLYPEFDAKKPVPAGQTFEFKFEKSGKWQYHDHLNPGVTGTITVE